ncbi:dihydrofolate reductase family protein [Nocardia asiatica]|uniref:dihydrofolate reductase family protein n=1 Tax=Nocardia asiatica TaxID=209252 RepID=UPI002457D7F7|nr:dihydrofolate reductase family protein [Nocardia asiatica]
MGKIVVTAFVTLDGVIQAPGLPDEDRDGGFKSGGWTQPYADPMVDQRTIKSVLDADALLIGRRTYELFASYWPSADSADSRTAHLNSQPKYVASRTLQTVGWNNATLLRGDVTEQVIQLKQRHDHISIWGSSQLITTLLPAGLIDEFVLLTYPIVIGGGKRLFDADTSMDLELTHTTTASTGVVISTYRRT